jgi:hypothetical protein
MNPIDQSRLHSTLRQVPEEVADVISRIFNETYLDEQQLHARHGMSLKWYQKARQTGHGIPYTEFGSRRLYSFSAVRTYELSNIRRHTSDPGPPDANLAQWFRNLAAECELFSLTDPSLGSR